MKSPFKVIPGSIVAPKGFLAAGVFCNIKRLGTGKGSEKGRKRDLAVIVSEIPASVAGMFTTSQVCAPPVRLCIERVKKGVAQALVVNSGNANACTGKLGMQHARAMTALLARELHMPTDHVLVGSTGRIGVPLPLDNVKAGIRHALGLLDDTPACADQAMEAIMTSDTRPKGIAVELKLGGRTARIGGICKGAGMIQPGMSATGARPATIPAAPPHATMLCFITTDAAVQAAALRHALREAVARSFNRISVDGDMSTNDTVLALANGLAGNPAIAPETRGSPPGKKPGPRPPARTADFRAFQAALSHVCLELAKMIVRDGEGVSRFISVRLGGARNPEEADAAARAVANSALVKTSWNGGDPNWGRVIAALGYSPARVIEEKVDIGYSAPGSRRILWSLKRGHPAQTPFKDLCDIAALREFDLHIRLNLGPAGAIIYTADLTEEYVDFNKGGVGDPASLGG